MKEFIRIGNQVFVAKRRFRWEESPLHRGHYEPYGFCRNERGEVLYAQPGRTYAATEDELRRFHEVS